MANIGRFATDRQCGRRNSEAGGFVEDPRAWRGIDDDVMTASDESRRFREDADFLSTPAVGRFGVCNRQQCSHVASASLARNAVALRLCVGLVRRFAFARIPLLRRGPCSPLTPRQPRH